MHASRNRHVDIFMESHKKAIQFGRKEAKVQVITPDDEHLQLPSKKETKKQKHEPPKNKEQIRTDEPVQKAEPHRSAAHFPAAAPVLKPQVRP